MLLFGISGPAISSGASTSDGTSTSFTCTTSACTGTGQTLLLFMQLQNLLNTAIISKLHGTAKIAVNGIIDQNTVNSVLIMASTGMPQFQLIDAYVDSKWVATNASALVQSLGQFVGLSAGVRSLLTMVAGQGSFTTPVAPSPSSVVPQDPSSLPHDNGSGQTQGATDPNGDTCTNLAPNGFCPITDVLGIICFRSDITSNGLCFGGPHEATPNPANTAPPAGSINPQGGVTVTTTPMMSTSMKLALGTLAIAGATLAGVMFYRRRD
jgi:hypothetical protein